jgi:predicted RNA binding protein YcfA (HicA-like mRNA interferase family)
MKKEIRDLIAELKQKGWLYVSQNRHHKMWHPILKVNLTLPVSPSCHHALKNLRKTIDKIEKRIK